MSANGQPCIALELYLEGIPSHQLEAELIGRALKKGEQRLKELSTEMTRLMVKQANRRTELAKLQKLGL